MSLKYEPASEPLHISVEWLMFPHPNAAIQVPETRYPKPDTRKPDP